MANANAVKIRSTKKKANGKPKYPKPSGANLAHNSAVNKATYWLNDGNKIIQSQSYNNTHEVNADWIKWENEARERYLQNEKNQRAIKSNAVLLEEGLIIIGTDVNAKEKDIEKIVKDFVAKFEKDNNTKVRHWAYHNHEGHEEDGKEHINRHVHFIFDNVNNDGVMVRRNWKRDYFKQLQTDIFNISKKYIKDIERAKESEYEEVQIEDRIVKVNTRKQIHHRVFRHMKENEQVQELNLKFTDMMKERDEAKKENKSLKTQVTKTKNEKAKLKELNKKLEEDIKKLNAELRESLKELGALRPQYAQLEQLNKDLKEELKNELLNHEKVLKSYQDLEKKLREELTKKDEKIDTLENENKDLKSELEALKYQLDLKEKRSQSYFGLNQDLKNEIIALKSQINDLEEQKEDLEEKVASRANMNDSELKKELQNIINDEIEVKSVKTGVFSTEEAPVIKNSKSFLQKIQDLTVQGTKKIKSEFEALKAKYNDLVKKFNEVTKEKDSLANENKSLKAELEELKERSSSKQQKKTITTPDDLVKQMEAGMEIESDSSTFINKKEVETEEEITPKTSRKRRSR